jgi:streptomycin 6-kinase
MTEFESKIISINGQNGKAWLDALPFLVQKSASRFGLEHLKPMPNLSYNYVLSGVMKDKPIILKLSLDLETLEKEALVIKCFKGYGVVNLIAEDRGLLLLEGLIPGYSLKKYFPEMDAQAVDVVCKVMNKLHQAPILSTLPHIKDWLAILQKNHAIPRKLLLKARALSSKLLQTAGPDVLLHGDLHHDNILKNSNDWLAIDPKGVIGESLFEVGAFIRNPIPELLSKENPEAFIDSRIDAFANCLNASKERIIAWSYVQSVLAWIWALEDGCDTCYWQELTKFFNVMSNRIMRL